MGGKVPAQFKQAQKIGELTIEEQKNRALLLVGSDLLWKTMAKPGRSRKFPNMRIGMILSQKTRRTRPMMSTSETKMVEKKVFRTLSQKYGPDRESRIATLLPAVIIQQ